MKNFLMTAAISLVASTAAYADNHAMDRGDMIRTRDITGGQVYATTADNWDMDTTYESVDESWDVIGEIEDLVLNRNGQLTGIIAEVGGFLDIGDKHVFIAVDDVRLVPTDDKSYGFVSPLSKDQLMEKENLDEGFWD